MFDKIQDYEELEQYFNEIPKFTVKHSLEETRRALAVLESAGECTKETFFRDEGSKRTFSHKKIIHVAGTNGKGSVCAYLCSILMEAGCRVGLFTSPHLVEMRERFQINREPVSRERFLRAFYKVMDHLEEMRTAVGQSDYYPTYFELLFLMGMVIFEEEELDYIVLETGLGGRKDATNAVEDPILTVITEIGFDHMQYLGDTIEKIAGEKAGILKPGAPVVFCDKRREVTDVIRKQAEMLGNRAIAVSEKECIHRILRKKSIDFSLYSRYYGYIRLTLETKALYQMENAALVVRCIEELPGGAAITAEQIKKGIAGAFWEGRMEEILPDVYVDGAHNEDGIRAFVQSVEVDGCTGNRYLLFSAVEDKDYRTMIDILAERPLFHRCAVAGIDDKRAAEPGELERIFAGDGSSSGIEKIRTFEAVKEALDYLLSVKKEDDCVYIVGSLYLVGEVKALLRRRTDD